MEENKDVYVQWLTAGLKKPGKNQSELARLLGTDASTVNKMVKGTRRVKVEELQTISTYIQEPQPLGGPREVVPIMGKVGADPEGTVLYAGGQGTGSFAPIPPGSTWRAVALEVAGHSMRGLADDGSLIFYDDRRDPPSDNMLGHVVVVGVDTEEIMIKRLLRGSRPGVYDLESIAGPTRRDATVLWAAHITSIVPPWRARQIIVHERY